MKVSSLKKNTDSLARPKEEENAPQYYCGAFLCRFAASLTGIIDNEQILLFMTMNHPLIRMNKRVSRTLKVLIVSSFLFFGAKAQQETLLLRTPDISDKQITIHGGTPKRVTFHPTADVLRGCLDNNEVYFTIHCVLKSV